MQYSLPLLPLKLHRAVAPTVSVRRICTSEALVGLKLRGIRELFVLSVPVTVCSSIVALRAIDTGSLAAIEKWLRVYIVVVVLAEATAHAFGLVEKIIAFATRGFVRKLLSSSLWKIFFYIVSSEEFSTST